MLLYNNFKFFEINPIERSNFMEERLSIEQQQLVLENKNLVHYIVYKLNIPYVIVIGEEEIKENKVTLKNMKTGEQKTEILENIINMIK